MSLENYLLKVPEICDAHPLRASLVRGSSGTPARSFPAGLPVRGRLGGISTPPGVAKGKPYPASDGYRHRAVVGTHRLPAEVFLEFVDPGVLRYGFVLEEPSPVVAPYSHLLELQHFFPMKPAIGAPDQGTVIVVLVPETRTGVLKPGGFSAGDVGVPDQCFIVLRGRREDELAGLAGGKQPLMIGGRDRLVFRECVVKGLEFTQPAFRVGDELHAKSILRFSAPDLVAAILAEFLRDLVYFGGKIGHHREERGGSRIGDRSLSLAVEDDVHPGIARRLFLVPDFPVDGSPAADTDHSGPDHFLIGGGTGDPVPGDVRHRFARRLPERRMELLQGHAAAPGGNLPEQNCQILVKALDIRRVAKRRTSTRHELRGMQREIQMSRAFSPRCARRSQHSA